MGDVGADYEQTGAGAITLKNTYVQGVTTDSKKLRIAASGERRHYVGDAVGTISVTLSDSGVAEHTSFKDAFGVDLSTPLAGERYSGLAQRERDTESGLDYFRARMYDPLLGRFTQTDPIATNRPTEHYIYASNNPVTHIDPTGLQDPTGLGLDWLWADVKAMFGYKTPGYGGGMSPKIAKEAFKEAVVRPAVHAIEWEVGAGLGRILPAVGVLDKASKFTKVAAPVAGALVRSAAQGTTFAGEEAVYRSVVEGQGTTSEQFWHDAAVGGSFALGGEALQGGVNAFQRFSAKGFWRRAAAHEVPQMELQSPAPADELATFGPHSAGSAEAAKIRLRHYTNAKGIAGIEESGVLTARDQNKVFFESARKQPLSPRDAEAYWGLKRGHGRNYVETDVYASRVQKQYNKRLQKDEFVVEGDVELDDPSFERR